MSRAGLRRSQRQYVLNSPALRLARDLPGVRPEPFPSYIEPLFATQWDHPPPGNEWLHEIKFDGYRLQLSRSDTGIRAYTRRGYDWAKRFPTITAAAGELKAHAAVLDGEAVVVTPAGDTDFAALESYVSSTQPDRAHHAVVFYAFDLLHLDGFDLRGTRLIDRKQVLCVLLADLGPANPIKFSEHLEGTGAEIYRKSCDLELEGIVSKRKDSRYRSGRSEAWFKLTCRHRDTFLVAGLAHKGKKFDGV